MNILYTSFLLLANVGGPNGKVRMNTIPLPYYMRLGVAERSWLKGSTKTCDVDSSLPSVNQYWQI